MAASPAYLYDATLGPVGHVGVLMKMFGQRVNGSYKPEFDAAVFSWPNGVEEGAKFAVRTEVPGDGTHWRSPHEVIHLRVPGRAARTNVAFVVLEGRSRATAIVSGGAARNHTKGIREDGILAELVAFSPLFQPLADEKVARSDLSRRRAAPATTSDIERALTRPGYTRTTGAATVINRSICRLLHWD